MAGFGLAELEAGVAVVDEQATFNQLVSRMGSKTRDNFMIDSFETRWIWPFRSQLRQFLE